MESLSRSMESLSSDHMESLSSDRHVDHSSNVPEIQCDAATSKLVFDLNDIATKVLRVMLTNRKVIAVTCGFYDPLGFLALIAVSFKVLLQRTCQLGLESDDLLSPELPTTWVVLLQSLQNTSSIFLPRSYFDRQPT